jgi:hypothetical protein
MARSSERLRLRSPAGFGRSAVEFKRRAIASALMESLGDSIKADIALWSEAE